MDTPSIRLRRVYDQPAEHDGYRVLVDRVWPRGVSRDAARIDEWARDLAPSHELRRWFRHDPARWEEFHDRYMAELRQHEDALDALTERAARTPVTLIYGARDERHNNAVVLQDAIELRRKRDGQIRPDIVIGGAAGASRVRDARRRTGGAGSA